MHYVRLMDLTGDPTLVDMLGGEEQIGKTLKELVASGAVLQAELPWMDETYYFINAPQGRAAGTSDPSRHLAGNRSGPPGRSDGAREIKTYLSYTKVILAP